MVAQVEKIKGRIRVGEVIIVTSQLFVQNVLLGREEGKWDNSWREMSGH